MSPRLGKYLATTVLALGLAAPALAARAVRTDRERVDRPSREVDIDALLRTMTREEKVGQLLMVGFGGTEVNRHIEMWVRDRKVGGVALFSRNIVNLEQTAKFARQLHDLTEDHIPIFLALDQEGGNVIRVKDGAMLLPGNMALGATRSATLAYVAGQALAIDLRRLGFNMNLAPVLDVNSNPHNPVIGIRSYGERPDLVADLGSWYVRGQQEMGVVAVAKHYPGHGDTQSDSHFSMPAVDVDATRLREVELWPFRRAVKAGLDAVMTAHIALPRVAESPELPATLSKNLLTNVLRGELEFDGITITDGLEMQGIVQQFGSGRAAVLAILAGADMPMILWTNKVKEEVYQALLEAVRAGEISEARLDQSVRRILATKARRGFFERRLESVSLVVENGNRNPIHEQVSQRIAREAVTLVRNHGDLLPIRPVRYRHVVVLAPSGPFAQIMARERNVTVVETAVVPSREARRLAVQRALDLGRDADLVVVAAINRYHVGMAKELTQRLRHAPMALVSLASPYYLSMVPEVEAYVCTYSYLDTAQQAAAEALLGRSPMNGRLPISIPGFYAFGHRVENRQIVSLPLSLGGVQ